MRFGQTAEQKQAERERKAAKQHAHSPVGRAEAAHAAGNEFFQLELDISNVGQRATSDLGSSRGTITHTGGKPDLLGQIEEIGWHLEHVGYVFVETGATTSNRVLSTGQGTVTKGKIVGIYLFRAT